MTSHGNSLPILILFAGLLLSTLPSNLAAQDQSQKLPPIDKELMLKWHFGGLPDDGTVPDPSALTQVDSNPEPKQMQPPSYPESMREQQLEGLVYTKLLIGKDGVPRKGFIVKIEGGNDDMAKTALETVRKWTFKPALLKGEPVEVWIVVPLKFRLS